MRRRAPTYTFGLAPAWSPSENYDVVVVGVPDATTGLGAMRPDRGPKVLRQVSVAISRGRSERESGWYDYVDGRRICSGLRWADAGDIELDPHAVGVERAKLPEVFDQLQSSCRLLVVLLGDDGLTFYAYCSWRGALLHVDAHEDALGAEGESPHHANFITYLDRCEYLQIGQYGLRGLVTRTPRSEPRRRHLMTVEDAAEWASQNSEVPLGIALDVDVLDPALMSSVGSPVPDGANAAEIVDLFDSVASIHHNVRRLTIAEFAPSLEGFGSQVDAMLLVHLILRSVDRVLRDP